MAKLYNREIVHELYANLKATISYVHALRYHQVYVRNHVFDFSLAMISSYLNYPIVESHRMMELDVKLDMNKVIIELIDFALSVWSKVNYFSSFVLSTKYSILHNIAIANWLPRLHISSISKDLVILLYMVGEDVIEPSRINTLPSSSLT